MIKRLLVCAVLVMCPAVASAQLGSVPNVFVPGTVISSSEVNTNFSTAYSKALNREGGTMTGTLTSLNIVPTTDSLYGIGTNSNRYATAYLDAADVTTLTISTLTCTGCVGPTQLAATAVSAASYGGANSIATFTVDADGRLTAAAGVTPQIPIATGVTGLGANVATALAVNVGSSGAFTTWGSSPTFGALTVTTMNGYTFNQSVANGASPTFGAVTVTTMNNYTFNQSVAWGASPAFAGTNFTSLPAEQLTGSIADARLSSNVALLGDNETVTGAWIFTASPVVDSAASAYLTLDRGAGTDYTGILFKTAGTNKWEIYFDNGGDTSGLNFYSHVAGANRMALSSAGALSWGGGSAISSSSNVAVKASTNVFTIWQHVNNAGTDAFIDFSNTGTSIGLVGNMAAVGQAGIGLFARTGQPITFVNAAGHVMSLSTAGAFTLPGALNVPGLVSLTGSAANIALGSNYLSGDGGNEGLSIDSSGNATFSANGVFTGTLRADGNRLLGTSIMDSVGTPSCTSGCTGITGRDYAFTVSGASHSADAVVTFGNTWTNAPVCTTAVAVAGGIYFAKVTTTTTTATLAFSSSPAGGDIHVICRGY